MSVLLTLTKGLRYDIDPIGERNVLRSWKQEMP